MPVEAYPRHIHTPLPALTKSPTSEDERQQINGHCAHLGVFASPHFWRLNSLFQATERDLKGVRVFFWTTDLQKKYGAVQDKTPRWIEVWSRTGMVMIMEP